MQRDLAVILPMSVSWQEVHEALTGLASVGVSFVSDFYGEGVPDGSKSLALRLHISHTDRTPTDAEAIDVERKALAILKRKFGAEQRS